MKPMTLFIYVLSGLIYFLPANSAAADTSNNRLHPQVKQLLNAPEMPAGVVFDIETLDAHALKDISIYVNQQINTIKQRYPNVDIAIISHGAEEFALQKQVASKNSVMHQLFNQMVNEQGISIHVCGAVGALKQLTQEDFPSFVSYSDSGMAQLNDYKAIGYSVITIQALSESQRRDLFEHHEKYLK